MNNKKNNTNNEPMKGRNENWDQLYTAYHQRGREIEQQQAWDKLQEAKKAWHEDRREHERRDHERRQNQAMARSMKKANELPFSQGFLNG